MTSYACTEACLVAWDDLLVNFLLLPCRWSKQGDSLIVLRESSDDLAYQAFTLIDLETIELLLTAGDDLFVKMQRRSSVRVSTATRGVST